MLFLFLTRRSNQVKMRKEFNLRSSAMFSGNFAELRSAEGISLQGNLLIYARCSCSAFLNDFRL